MSWGPAHWLRARKEDVMKGDHRVHIQFALLCFAYFFIMGWLVSRVISIVTTNILVLAWSIIVIVLAIMCFVFAGISKCLSNVIFERILAFGIDCGGVGIIMGSIMGLVGYIIPGSPDSVYVGLRGGLAAGFLLGFCLAVYMAVVESQGWEEFFVFSGMGLIAGGIVGVSLGVVTNILGMGTSGFFDLILVFGTEGFVVFTCLGAALKWSESRKDQKEREESIKATDNAMSDPLLKIKVKCERCGFSWKSVTIGLKIVLGGNVSAFYNSANPDGLHCTRCRKSWCKGCLGRHMPKTLPGGQCPSCGAKLDLFHPLKGSGMLPKDYTI